MCIKMIHIYVWLPLSDLDCNFEAVAKILQQICHANIFVELFNHTGLECC